MHLPVPPPQPRLPHPWPGRWQTEISWESHGRDTATLVGPTTLGLFAPHLLQLVQQGPLTLAGAYNLPPLVESRLASFLQKCQTHMPFDPATPLLGSGPIEMLAGESRAK